MADPGGRGEEGEGGMRHVARDGGWVKGWSVKGARRGERGGGERRRGGVEMRGGRSEVIGRRGWVEVDPS
jgi:hypothetical protein